MPNTIFITGASTGLGRATALLFAEREWNVIATMRRPEGDPLANVPNVTVLPLDVTRPEQIDAAAKGALARGPVDVVFANAGYGLAGPLEGTTDEQIVRNVETNLLGVIRTTRAFIPAFRERRAGTFIATSSIGGLVTFPFNSVYHATKWALQGFAESLAFELGRFGVRVKTIAPGGIRTDFAGRSLDLAQHPAYAPLLAKTAATFRDPAHVALGSSAEEVAAVVWEAATDGRDQLTYVVGKGAEATYTRRLAVGVEKSRAEIGDEFLGDTKA